MKDRNATYWAIKRRQRQAATAPAEIPTADTATKAELIAAAEAAGVDFKTTDTKAEIAAKLAAG